MTKLSLFHRRQLRKNRVKRRRRVLAEATDGIELWINPTTQTIDENNYSTYDAETSICRIVSGGTFVNLKVTGALSGDSSDNYKIVYEELERSGSTLKIADGVPNYEFVLGNEIIKMSPIAYDIVMARNALACDITFKLSVQKLKYND